MSKFKIGFTLSEVLVTLGIVGVISALVIPPLTAVSNNAVSAKSLSRIYELVQNGMKNVLSYAAENNTDEVFTTLDGIQLIDINPAANDAEKNDFILNNDSGKAIFSKTLGLIGAAKITSSYLSSVKTYSGANITTVYESFTTWDIYKFTKNNGYVIVQPIPIASLPAGVIDSDRVLTRIFIDTNGEKSPNKIGKDVFLFGLTNNGHLVPAGSSAYNKNIYGESISAFNASSIGDGRACAANVMQNNWKIDY